jgi:hypothetical protein
MWVILYLKLYVNVVLLQKKNREKRENKTTVRK